MKDPAPAAASPSRPISGGDLTFEQALEQLESIVQRIESGESGLERSLAEYERGVGLIRRCRDILTKTEQRVEELTKLAEDGGGGGMGAGSGTKE